MSEMKHTPGPWEVGEDQRGTRRVFAGKYEIVRALSTHGFGNRLSKAEREANAALIAAAPDMLEALKNALAAGLPDVVASAARAAIAKAEGRVP